MIPFSHSLRSQFFLRLVLPWLSFGFSLVAQINSIQSPTNVVFSSGRTYLVEKKLELIDSVRFEPGTVIKFRPGAGLKISPSTQLAILFLGALEGPQRGRKPKRLWK